MAQQFEVQALGLNGIPYRIEIYNSNYSGTTVTQLDGDQQFIRFEGGQRERVGIEPIWGKEVRINVRTNEDLSPLFGLEDRDAEVRVYRTDTSSLVWKGFILTDFFQDEPLTDLPGVELRAVDGLTTLEGDSFDALSGVSDSDIDDDGSFISYTDLFTGVLSTLYDSPLDVEFAVEWYPDAGGQLSSSDNPLRYSGARPDVYYDSEDGAWLDQQSALEDALKSQGLEIRQAVIGGELTWLLAQPTALSASSVKTWRYAPGGTEDASSPFTRDLSLDLSSADTNRPTREFERRTQEVSVTHDHGELDNILSGPGFEDQGASWSFTSGLEVSGSVIKHDFAAPTPQSVQDDTFVLELTDNSSGLAFPVSQNFGDIAGLPPRSVGRLKQTFSRNGARYEKVTRQQATYEIRLEIGGQYLTDFFVDVRQAVNPGTGSLPVQAIDRPIPEGARLPIQPKRGNVGAGDSLEAQSYITLSERAEVGDTTLEGEISQEVSGDLQVRYAGFGSTQDTLEVWKWKPDTTAWSTFEVIFALTDGNGNRVTGNTTVEIGGQRAQPGGPVNANLTAYADDIDLSVEVGGSVLAETTRVGSVPANGKDRDVSVLLSSGPTSENPRRVKGLAPGDFSYQAVDWGIGAGGGSLSLAGLQARERLRYLRQHLERQQLTVYARDKSPVVTGEEIVQFDGKTWRIAEFSSDPYNGEIGLTLIQHADAGTADLTVGTVRDTESGGTTGGGGAAPAVGGGGGAVTVVQNEVVAFPSAGSPDRFRVSDTTAPESGIQDAIDYAANQGGGSVVLGSAVVDGGYDVSQVSFDLSVLMEVAGQRGVGYNVRAYGAAGDSTTDDHAAFQAAHDQAEAKTGSVYSTPKRTRLYVPETSEGGYTLGDQWHIRISEVEVCGAGMYSGGIRAHPDFDPTNTLALVRVGDGTTGSPSETQSIYLHDLNIDGGGKEISGLQLHFWFSGFVHNCRLAPGAYNEDNIGRDTAGLDIRSGKNLWTHQCQMATSGGYGVLVDDRGASSNQHNQDFHVRDCLITENDEGGIRIKDGAFDTKIINSRLGANGQNSHSGHPNVDVLIQGGFSNVIRGNIFSGSKHGVVNEKEGKSVFKTENNDFEAVSGQSIVDLGSTNNHSIHINNVFDQCGSDHVDGGAIKGDYRQSDHVADIHIEDPFRGVLVLQENVHFPDSSATVGDRYSGIASAGGTFSGGGLDDDPDTYHLIAGNTTNENGYQARTGDEVLRGQVHMIDPDKVVFQDVGEEAAGVGNTPTASKWQVGNLVFNTDDNPPTLHLLKPDGSWYNFSQDQLSFDKGNDGIDEIQRVGQISSQNDPQNIWSVGPETNELLVDGDPIAYREEDETITGQWEYEQEIDWTSQINGVGYEGYIQIPVDSASQTEYILISKLDGNGNNQRLTADLFIGRTAASSVNDHGQIRVYWNQGGAGANRNFATETLMDVEGASEVFDARPVEVAYNGDQWAAVEVSVGFGNIQWRTLQPHHTGNYSLSVVESKSAANISNVTFWGDSSAGSLGRQELHVQRLQHDASRSHSFTSGFTGSGWTLETLGPDGKPDYMEAGHMVLRGTLRVRELILEQLRVRKGIQIISPGGGKLEKVEPSNRPVDAPEFESWDIVGVDTTRGTFTVDDTTGSIDPTTALAIGQSINVSRSTGNDANYTVESVTDLGSDQSEIAVQGRSIPDGTADGAIHEVEVQEWFFEDPNDLSSAHGMALGDRVLAQRFDPDSQKVVAQIRGVVEGIVSTHRAIVSVGSDYTVPSPGAETEGYEFAVVASSQADRQSILVDSPFQPGREVLDGLSDFDDWDSRADFLRMNQGNLDGRYDYTQEAYGMAAGDPDDVWISADDTKGVRMVDNTQGNQTVRAQLQGPSLTLGDTADDHIKIDPAGGLQMINDQGTEVARLNGTLLRLGSTGQIQFDPTASPEARIEGTLQMGSGDIRAQTGGENSLLINGATSFSNGPTETQQDAVTQSFSAVSDSTQTSFLNSSTNPEYTHRLEITVDVASGATDGAEVRVDIDDASDNDLTGELFIVQPGNATTRSVTFVPNSNSVDVSTRAIANGPNMTTVDVSYTLYDMPPLTEMTAVGMRVWKSGSKYITLGDGKIESDEYYFGSGYQLKRKGTDLFWIAPDGTETQIN